MVGFSVEPASVTFLTGSGCRAIPPVAYGKQPAARKTAREVQVQGATCGRRNSGERRHELSAAKIQENLMRAPGDGCMVEPTGRTW
ncbi:hypothetical protein ACLKA7_000848 [Drosophila subpalustris]